MEAAEREERKKGVKKSGPRASESLGTAATPGSLGGGPAIVKKRKMSGAGGPAEKRKRGGPA